MTFPRMSALRTCAALSSSKKTDAATAGRNRRTAVACAVLSAWEDSPLGQRTLQPTGRAPGQMRRGHEFLPKPAFRRDRRQITASNAAGFLRRETDCGKGVQTIRI